MFNHSIKRTLNPDEKKLADENPKEYLLTMKLAAKAMFEEEARYSTAGEDRGNSNAFLHAYWSCLLAKNISLNWAKKWTNAHEQEENQDNLDRQIDLFNNALGFEIAQKNKTQSNEFLAGIVEKAILEGMGKIIVKGVLKQSSSIGTREKNIFEAIYKNILSIVLELLTSNQINSQNGDLMTPLMVACITEFKEAVEALIPHGNIQKRDRYNRTVLMHSINSSEDIFKLVLDSTTSVNEQDNEGQTALMFAAARGDQKKVKALLSKGADVNIKMNNNFTAYDLACSENHFEVAQILRIN